MSKLTQPDRRAIDEAIAELVLSDYIESLRAATDELLKRPKPHADQLHLPEIRPCPT